MSLQLYFNEGAEDITRALVASQTDNRERSVRQQVSNDKIPIEIFASDGKGNIVDLSGGTVKLGIGDKNGKPASGDWSLDDGSNVVTVSHNVTTASLQASLRAVTFNGDAEVSVDGCPLSPYILTYSTVGTRSIPTINLASLNPISQGSIVDMVTGGASTVGKQLVRYGKQPEVLVASFTATGNGGVSGSMGLATEGIIQALCGVSSVVKTLEVEFTDSNGNVRTLGQVPITISGEVIPDGATGTVQLSSYALESYVDSKFTSTQTFSRKVSFQQDVDIYGKARFRNGVRFTGGGAVATSSTITKGTIVNYTSTLTSGNILLTIDNSAFHVGDILIIHDEGGVASKNNIGITADGGATIESQSTVTIDADHGSFILEKFSTTNWNSISDNGHHNSSNAKPVVKNSSGIVSTATNAMRKLRTAITVTATLSTKNTIYGVSGAGRTHTLDASVWENGEWATVKDEGGNAFTSNIIVTVSNGTIDGATNVNVTATYGSVEIYSDGTNFFTK